MLRDLPAFLTVEQAAAELQLGRSKAYELTVEWERTGGQSGLPFVRFGHQKRIPTNWLIHLTETVPASSQGHCTQRRSNTPALDPHARSTSKSGSDAFTGDRASRSTFRAGRRARVCEHDVAPGAGPARR